MQEVVWKLVLPYLEMVDTGNFSSCSHYIHSLCENVFRANCSMKVKGHGETWRRLQYFEFQIQRATNDRKLSSCGRDHVVVALDGKLYAAGDNHFGQTGMQDGGTGALRSLIHIHTRHQICQVAAGEEYSMYIAHNGTVFAFGNNDSGQLGLGHRRMVRHPSPIVHLSNTIIACISCGTKHTLFITNEGYVYTCGKNTFGMLGHGDTIDRVLPSKIPTHHSLHFIQAAAGETHSILLSQEGSVYIAGSNAKGQLGTNPPTRWWTPPKQGLRQSLHFQPLPPSYSNYRCIQIAASSYSSYLLTQQGRVFTFGMLVEAQPVSQKLERHYYHPTLLSNFIHYTIRIIYPTSSSVHFLTNDRCIRTWHDTPHGPVPGPNPMQVDSLNFMSINGHVKSISIGERAGYAIASDNSVWNWGLLNHLSLADKCANHRTPSLHPQCLHKT